MLQMGKIEFETTKIWATDESWAAAGRAQKSNKALQEMPMKL